MDLKEKVLYLIKAEASVSEAFTILFSFASYSTLNKAFTITHGHKMVIINIREGRSMLFT